MSEWCDIETVPKDGSAFDVWAVGPNGLGVRVPDCRYVRSFGKFEIWGPNNRLSPHLTPKHWRPVPLPPEVTS